MRKKTCMCKAPIPPLKECGLHNLCLALSEHVIKGVGGQLFRAPQLELAHHKEVFGRIKKLLCVCLNNTPLSVVLKVKRRVKLILY